MAKGTVTEGMVLALASVPPASLCLMALAVVATAVPAIGCTYCKSFCAAEDAAANNNTESIAVLNEKYFFDAAIIFVPDFIS
jgi:Zn finger protein HypA/HybF involved in hydrogenase expression